MTPLLLVSSLALASTAFAAEPTQADTQLYFNGVKVAIDPVTGKLRQPTAAESAALRMSVAKMPVQKSRGKAMPKTRAEANRTVRRMRDGSVMMSVSEDMMSTAVATRQADGSISIVEHQGDATTQESGNE
ncbi:MAG: hypothetical protein LH470_12245 [Lysobacter sp.]|nr:hypothetical protein [Lysobacter sp.]